MKRIILCSILFAAAVLVFGCSSQTGAKTNNSTGGDSPTAAYKRLYTAVKAKDQNGIKAAMSKKTIEFATMAAGRENKTLENVLENGLTATTFDESLPQIRDERINGDMGAVEVHNDKENKWEDLPFVLEDGSWKLAIGEMFANTWKSPGKSQSEKEREAANALSNNMIPMNVNGNANFTAVHPIIPKPASNSPNINANIK